MPLLWRYLLGDYFKIFFLSTLTFIGVLLTTRLNEIAHFATMGPELHFTIRFILYQIPYILPIAIPVATLLASILLFQRLSGSHELTALRASGLGLRHTLAPLLLAGVLLSIGNYYVISELATQSHLATTALKHEVRSVNPLLLLRNKHLMRAKGFYFNTLGPSKMGRHAIDAVFAAPNKRGDNLSLVVAKKLIADENRFAGEQVTLINTLSSDRDTSTLLIENMGNVAITIDDFTQAVEKSAWTLHNDHLSLSLLLTRLTEERQFDDKASRRSVKRIYSELLKRFSVGAAPLSFTLMGCCFGMSIGRRRHPSRLIAVILMGALYLICFFAAQGVSHRLATTTLLYLLPHLFIIGASLWMAGRVARGME